VRPVRSGTAHAQHIGPADRPRRARRVSPRPRSDQAGAIELIDDANAVSPAASETSPTIIASLRTASASSSERGSAQPILGRRQRRCLQAADVAQEIPQYVQTTLGGCNASVVTSPGRASPGVGTQGLILSPTSMRLRRVGAKDAVRLWRMEDRLDGSLRAATAGQRGLAWRDRNTPVFDSSGPQR
jgi:hypothetical protein